MNPLLTRKNRHLLPSSNDREIIIMLFCSIRLFSSARGPDFRNLSIGEGLWIGSCPEWVLLKLKNLNTPDNSEEGQTEKKTSKTQPNKYCNEIQQATDKVGVLVSALKECRGPKDVQKVKMVHQAAMESNTISSIYVANSLVNSYAKCRGMSEARRVFDGMCRRTSVTWNVLMFGYVENGEAEAALELFARMEQEPDARSFLAAVKACTSLALKEEAREVDGKLVKVESLNKGMSIHSQALDNGHGGCMFLASTLVDMYAKCGRMDKALEQFNKMESHNTVSWSALMFGYIENCNGEAALELFARMEQKPDAQTFLAAVKACTFLALKEEARKVDGKLVKVESLNKGMSIHSQALENGHGEYMFLANSLVDMYAKCGRMDKALEVFNKMKTRNTVSWNALMFGFVENSEGDAALELFERMEQKPDAQSFLAATKACTFLALNEDAREVDGKLVKVKSLNKGMSIHSRALANRHGGYMFLANSLVDMYAKCGRMDKALDVFNKMESHNTASWNALMFGYVENGEEEVALELFACMQKEPDARSFIAAVKACTSLALQEEAKEVNERLVKVESLNKGMFIHSKALDNGHGGCMFLASSLVDMYAKCGRMDKALEVFNKMESHDSVCWNALIFGYGENGDGERAFKLFMRMKTEGCAPDDRSFVAVLKGCTSLAMKEDGKTIAGRIVKQASLEKGVVIHNQAVNSGYGSSNRVRNSLIDMYAKCGNIMEARKVFDATGNLDTVSWTSMILGYADNGLCDLAIELFMRMRREGRTPDAVTFIAVLKACKKVVAFQTGKDIHAAIREQGLDNENEIANCLVDFYGKCGSMAEAQNIFDSLAKKNLVTWNALMAGYSRHGDTGHVFQLFEQMRSKGVQPNGVTFLCLLTACSHAGLVEQGKEFFKAMGSEFQVKQEREHYHCMIDILGRTNRLKESLSLLEEMPYKANFVTWMTVLGACRKWKNLEVGRLAFDSVIKLDDKDASAYLLMENIYGSLNMWEEQRKIESMRLNARVWRVPGHCWWTDQSGMVHTFLAGDTSHPQNDNIRAKLKQILAVMKEQGYKADLGSVVRDMSEQDKEDSLCGHSEKLAIACALINTKPGDTIQISKNLRVCNDCHIATAFISKIEKRNIICRDASRFHVFRDGICSCGDFW